MSAVADGTTGVSDLDDDLAQSAARRRRVRVGRAALAVGLLAVWELGHLWVGDLFVPDPIAVATRIAALVRSGILFEHLWATVKLAAIGFLIGGYLGIAAAFLLHRWQRLEQATAPYIMASMGIPKFALAPLLILWFGIGASPKLVIVASMVFYLVFVPVLSGLHSVDRRLIDMARILGASNRVIRRTIFWKSVMPFILAGLKVALPRAVGAEIVGEFLVADRGLGFYIENSRQMADTVGVFAGIVVVTALILVIDAGVAALSQQMLAWRVAAPDTVL